MNREIDEKAREARDFTALTESVLAACEPFGPASGSPAVGLPAMPAYQAHMATR